MLKNDIIFTVAGNVLAMVLGLGSAVLFARGLGADGRGLMALAVLLPQIAATFCRLGGETVNATFAGLYKDKRSALFLQSLLIASAGGLVSMVLVLGFFWLPVPHGEFDKIDTLSLVLAACLGPCMILCDTMAGMVRGVGRIGTAALLPPLQAFVLLASGFVLVYILKCGVAGAVAAMSASFMVGGLVAIVILRQYITLKPAGLDRQLLSKGLRFGAVTACTTLATFLVYRLDQVMLGYMVSVEDLGLYVVAVGLAERLRVLPGSISTAFLPRLSNELSSRQAQTPQVFRFTMIVSFASALVAAVLGAPAIVLLFGWEFLRSIPPFAILLPGIAFLGGAAVLSGDLLARGKPVYALKIGYLVLVVQVLLNFTLIPLIGIAGAAAAATCAYMFACGLVAICYHRESSAPIRQLMPTRQDARQVLEMATGILRRALSCRLGRSAVQASADPVGAGQSGREDL